MSINDKEDGKRSCFIICPIGERDSPERIRSDKLIKHVIRPVMEELGVSATAAHEMQEPGQITKQIIHRLFFADVVVADLSDCNPNVYYEYGIRHAFVKHCIPLIQQGESLPFDVKQPRAIVYDLSDLDNIDDCKYQLHGQVQAILSDNKAPDNVVADAINSEQLRAEDMPSWQVGPEILNLLGEIRRKIDDMNSNVVSSINRIGNERGKTTHGHEHSLEDSALTRKDLIAAIAQRGGPPEGWRTNPDTEAYRLMKEAEEDDAVWRLLPGDKVRIQLLIDDQYNGAVGKVEREWRRKHHYYVSFPEVSGLSERAFHVMYLTRYAWTDG